MKTEEAFVYCWTNKTNGKKYIGYHKGTQDDGYICSSKTVLQLFRLNPDDFERSIIATGSKQDMIKLERKMLQSVNAAWNDDYYNQSNGGGVDHTPEIRAKMRKPLSDETKAKMRKPKTKEHAENISKGRKGMQFTQEHRDNISKASKAQIRKPHSAETIEVMRQKKKEYWAKQRQLKNE